MEMILLTDSEPLEGEHELIAECFERGLQNLHLRKYQTSEQGIIELLKKIPENFHPRIVLHHHHYLVRSFNLKGVHFNSYSRGIEDFPKGELLFSRALHDPEALDRVERMVDRVLLSPVYPSISKKERKEPLPLNDLKRGIAGGPYAFELFALGGVTPERIRSIEEMGFDGFAVLGAIWDRYKKEGQDGALEGFEAFQKEVRRCQGSE